MRDNGVTMKALSDYRRKRAWELRIKGYKQQEIADELKIDQGSVCRLLKVAGKMHYKEFMENINDYKKQQTVELEEIAQEALKCFYRSQKNIKSTTKESVLIDGISNGEVNKKVTKSQQNGDAKFLSAYFKAKEDIRKIWGMEEKVTAKTSTGNVTLDAMSIDDKVKLFTSIPIEDRLKLIESMITQKPIIAEPELKHEYDGESNS